MKGRLPTLCAGALTALFLLALGPAAGSAPAALPTVSNVEVSSITPYDAQLSGTVNPNGAPTFWSFEIQKTGSDEWATIENSSLDGGTEPVPLQTEANALDPATGYQVRLKAIPFNPVTFEPLGTVYSPSPTPFTTPAAPPFVTRVDVTLLNPFVVRFGGAVFPEGTDTNYGFLYRKAGAPEWDTAATGRVAGSSGSEVVAAEVDSLEPATAYEVTLSATNASGQVVQSPEPTGFTTNSGPAVRVRSATAKVTRKTVVVRTEVVISDPGDISPGRVVMRGVDVRGGKVLCRTTKTVVTPGRHEVRCNLGSKGRQQLRKRPLQLSMRASYMVTYREGFKLSEVAERDLTIKRKR